MELTLTIWLVAELEDAKDDGRVCITANHDLTKEDLEEFVQLQGYTDYKAYFRDHVDEEDLLSDIIGYVEQGKTYLVETEIDVCCGDKDSLHGFLLRKYQGELLADFMKKINDRCADFNVEA